MRYGKSAKFEIVSHQADVSIVDIIDTYRVGDCTVYITRDGRYLAAEPALTKEAHRVYSDMMDQLYYSLEPLGNSDDPVRYIEDHLWKEAERWAITDMLSVYFSALRYYLVRDILGYGILDVLMNDDGIEEITVERFDVNVGVIHRRYGEFNILDSNVSFGSPASMNSFIQRIMHKTGTSVTTAMPIMNSMTRGGDRITVTFGNEVSLPGPTMNIRKFTREPLTVAGLLQSGTLNEVMAAYFWMLIDAKSFGLLVGETGSGKTTMVNALMGLSNPRWKIITIEDTPELKMPHRRWVRLITRTSPTVTRSSFDITLMDLIRASLRMRPDFMIVGEVRGAEAQYLFQSAATGHGGLTTFHASSAEAALNRLASEPINIRSGQQMLLWYVAHTTKISGERKKVVRKISSVKEVLPQSDSVYFNEVFAYDQKTGEYDTKTADQLLKKSRRIHDAAKILNVEPRKDIQMRIQLLSQCMEADASKVISVVSRLYA